MSLGLVVLEKKLFTQTRTPQSDDIKMNILYSQMRFQLYQAHIMSVIWLKSDKKVNKLGVCGHFRDLKVTLN